MTRQTDRRYKALNHPIRREIVKILAKNPQTYTHLLNRLNIESGHLAYHLRNLDYLLEKNSQGYYYLNSRGVQAHDFLTGKSSGSTEMLNERKVIAFVYLSILLIVGLILFAPVDEIAEQRYEEKKSDTMFLLDRSFNIIYKIFDGWEIPRNEWTSLLLNIVNLESNLEILYEYSEDVRLKNYLEELEFFEKELSEIIIEGDPDYFKLTIEKRYLIRELHSLFLKIEDSI